MNSKIEAQRSTPPHSKSRASLVTPEDELQEGGISKSSTAFDDEQNRTYLACKQKEVPDGHPCPSGAMLVRLNFTRNVGEHKCNPRKNGERTFFAIDLPVGGDECLAAVRVSVRFLVRALSRAKSFACVRTQMRMSFFLEWQLCHLLASAAGLFEILKERRGA
jgi:hypothetical protein